MVYLMSENPKRKQYEKQIKKEPKLKQPSEAKKNQARTTDQNRESNHCTP